MAAAYPGAIKSFGAAVVDAVDTVYAAHINDLRDEVVAVESELGTGLKASSWSVGNTSFTTATSSWPTLAQRLVNIENGLVTTNDVHTQYVKRAGDSLTGNLAMGGTSKLTNLAAGSDPSDSLRYNQVLASSSTLISGLFSGSTPARDSFFGSSGSSAQPARADHVHPTSTPIGAIIAYGAATPPPGGDWLICDGSAVSRTTYANLFSAIGTTHGAGNGTTTFNLPDLRARFIVGAGPGQGNDSQGNPLSNRSFAAKSGAETVKLTSNQSGVPAHSHPITDPGHGHGITDPGHSHQLDLYGSGGNLGIAGNWTSDRWATFAATTGISINPNYTFISVNNNSAADAAYAHENMPPFYVLTYIIKAS